MAERAMSTKLNFAIAAVERGRATRVTQRDRHAKADFVIIGAATNRLIQTKIGTREFKAGHDRHASTGEGVKPQDGSIGRVELERCAEFVRVSRNEVRVKFELVLEGIGRMHAKAERVGVLANADKTGLKGLRPLAGKKLDKNAI